MTNLDSELIANILWFFFFYMGSMLIAIYVYRLIYNFVNKII